MFTNLLNNYGKEGFLTPVVGEDIADVVTNGCDLFAAIPDSEDKAIFSYSKDGDINSINYRDLKRFITSEFPLKEYGIGYGNRVSVMVPNSAELAILILSVMSHWCIAPINSTATAAEVSWELGSVKATVLIVKEGMNNTEAAIKAAEELDIGIILLKPRSEKTGGLFDLVVLKEPKPEVQRENYSYSQKMDGRRSYAHPETVLLIHTSGTSGNKKCVPYSMDMVLVGAGCIISSWNLKNSDKCLNMMPLFHIGGIMRNLISPILSGGSVICCSGFDPVIFWELLKLEQFTWYYAAPTMHQAILQEAEKQELPLPVQSVRFIANAAGGLLPVLANQLRDKFNAVILTSYGMSECMPISSPTQGYRLSPTGTSGQPVGPSIVITDEDHTRKMKLGEVGNILIRGVPCFSGYENNNAEQNAELFFTIDNEKGWFDTGDMGYMDKDGFLFISGRSKEIINKGGETISPFEIEEVVVQHPFLKETIAFSAPHERYQETVGIVLVNRDGYPRIDIPTLHKFIDGKLHRSKWPQVIIYMNAVPKNLAGKVLRIKMAERTKMVFVNEESNPNSRLYEAICPVQGAPLTQPIVLTQIERNIKVTSDFLQSFEGVKFVQVIKVDLPHRLDSLVAFISSLDKYSTEDIKKKCDEKLHSYLSPVLIIMRQSLPLNANKNIDIQSLQNEAVDVYVKLNIVQASSEDEKKIEKIWIKVLNAPKATIYSVHDSFFDIGGDSLKIGQVVSLLRKAFGVNLAVGELFEYTTISQLANLIQGKSSTLTATESMSAKPTGKRPNARNSVIPIPKPEIKTRQTTHRKSLERRSITNLRESISSSWAEVDEESMKKFENYEYSLKHKSTHISMLFFQALPALIVNPMKMICCWFYFAFIWVTLLIAGVSKFPGLIVAVIIAKLTFSIAKPLIGIALKWIIVRRYKPGRHSLFSLSYLRWWLVEKLLIIFDRGIFEADIPLIENLLGTSLLRLYYVMLGATIGKNFKLSKSAKIGQADLLFIGDNVCIESATVRPFSLEEGHYLLVPIYIGNNCCVGDKSILAPGTVLDNNTCIGPCSSSYEIEDASPDFRKYCRGLFSGPPMYLKLLLGYPLLFFSECFIYLPVVFVLQALVGLYSGPFKKVTDVILWFSQIDRLPYFIYLRLLDLFEPLLHMFIVILIKRFILGRITEDSNTEVSNDWRLFQKWMMPKLLRGPDWGGVLKLIGSHYEIVSIIYRLLGSKIGKRVYWPGSGVDISEFDLFEVGDDVVFGSRSTVLISSKDGGSKTVKIDDGVMLADRCVVLPGAHMKKLSIIGSGSIVPENFVAAPGSVWVGSKGGKPLCLAPENLSCLNEDTITPFGKAFYNKEAPYYVLSLPIIVCYSIFWNCFCIIYKAFAMLTVFYVFRNLYLTDTNTQKNNYETFKLFIPIGLASLNAFQMSYYCIEILAKWVIIGRRTVGSFRWDESSYCQRWQIFLTSQSIRGKTMDLITGSYYLVLFFRALGCTIGESVCLYPNGGDPMMTEPELVTIGDGAAIDEASLIAHINTKGEFKLNALSVGDNTVMKSGTRLLSGGKMQSRSILLEHTLVMGGEIVDFGSVWQGWPGGDDQFLLDEYRIYLGSLMDEMRQLKKLKKNKFVQRKNRFDKWDDEEEGIAINPMSVSPFSEK